MGNVPWTYRQTVCRMALRLFGEDAGRPPDSFIEFVRWGVDNEERLIRMCALEWPAYFERSLRGIFARYSRIYDILAGQ